MARTGSFRWLTWLFASFTGVSRSYPLPLLCPHQGTIIRRMRYAQHVTLSSKNLGIRLICIEILSVRHGGEWSGLFVIHFQLEQTCYVKRPRGSAVSFLAFFRFDSWYADVVSLILNIRASRVPVRHVEMLRFYPCLNNWWWLIWYSISTPWENSGHLTYFRRSYLISIIIGIANQFFNWFMYLQSPRRSANDRTYGYRPGNGTQLMGECKSPLACSIKCFRLFSTFLDVSFDETGIAKRVFAVSQSDWTRVKPWLASPSVKLFGIVLR